MLNGLREEKMNFQRLCELSDMDFSVWNRLKAMKWFLNFEPHILINPLSLQSKFQVYDLCVVFVKTIY